MILPVFSRQNWCYSEFELEFILFPTYQILSLLRTIVLDPTYRSQYTENLIGWKKNEFEHKFTITPILARKNGQNHVFARVYMNHTQIVFALNKHEFWRELLPKSGIHSILRIHKSDLQRFEIGGVLARECGRNGTL